MSLPSRERGLKYQCFCRLQLDQIVAPLAGAWIEMRNPSLAGMRTGVAPLAGAWIEIHKQILVRAGYLSLPSRERGLKLSGNED